MLLAVGRVVGINQLCIVFRDLCNGVLVDGSSIFDNNRLSDLVLNIHDLDRQQEVNTACSIAELVLVRGQLFAANFNCDILVEGQTFGHFIGNGIDILGKAGGVGHLTGDGVVDDFADLNAFLIIHLVKRNVVLIMDDNVGVRGGQVGQRIVCANNQIVAEVESGRSRLAVCNGQRNAGLPFNSRLEGSAELCGTETGSHGDNIGIFTGSLGKSQVAISSLCISINYRIPRRLPAIV